MGGSDHNALLEAFHWHQRNQKPSISKTDFFQDFLRKRCGSDAEAPRKPGRHFPADGVRRRCNADGGGSEMVEIFFWQKASGSELDETRKNGGSKIIDMFFLAEALRNQIAFLQI